MMDYKTMLKRADKAMYPASTTFAALALAILGYMDFKATTSVNPGLFIAFWSLILLSQLGGGVVKTLKNQVPSHFPLGNRRI
jgi:hypothetical protein